MSGHQPTHTRMPVGNSPPGEHGIGGWNLISHEAPGLGAFSGLSGTGLSEALNQNSLRGMVPQTAHMGSALPLHSSHPAWRNKVPGSSHNGDGSGLTPNPSPSAPPSAAANHLFMQLLANRDRGVAAAVAAAGYCGTNPYQAEMIDLSRPAAPSERTEPPGTGNSLSDDKESHALCVTRNGTAASESTAPLNGQLDSESRSAPAVSVIATNPSHEKSFEQKVGKVENPVREVVRSSDGSVNLNCKTDSDKNKAPAPHLKAAPVHAIVGHGKKIKSVEAIIEHICAEMSSKKREADSTNTPGPLTDSTSQNSHKPNIAQTVPKPDSNVSDQHGESEEGDCKMRRKRKIDTPRKSMSPPPIKKALVLEQTVVSINPEMSSQSQITKPSSTSPNILPVPADSSVSMTSANTNPSSTSTTTPLFNPSSVLAENEGDSNPTLKDPIKSEVPVSTSASSEPVVDPSVSSAVAPVKEESLPTASTSQNSVAPSSECPVSTPTESALKEDTKSAVVDVESKMEALFAGIIGSGDEGAAGPSEPFGGDLSNPLTPLNESLDLDPTSNIAAVLEAKPPSAKKGRPKGSRNGIRQSSDSIFGTSSTESTPQKGKKAKKKTVKDSIFGESPAKKNKKAVAAGKKIKFQKEPSQQTCDSGSTISSVRIRGPVVHCVGPRDSPSQVSVVNAPSRGDDEDQEKSKKTTARRQKLVPSEGKVTSSGLCSSTLVTRGELDHPQNSNVWICVFCKMGPHVNGAGDLFGPYLIGESEFDSDHDVNDKKKGKHSGVNSPPGSQLGMLPVTPSLGEKPHYVVWLHEDCAVWASGVYLVGARLAGLDEAIWAAVNTKCDRCRHYGANLGCIQHGCPQRAHYKCAQDSGWYLNEDLFKSTCSIHPMKEDMN